MRPPVGSRRQRQPGHLRVGLEQRPQQPVIGPEVVTPFADAMRLVDGNQGEGNAFREPPEAIGRRPLRRDIDEVELAR